MTRTPALFRGRDPEALAIGEPLDHDLRPPVVRCGAALLPRQPAREGPAARDARHAPGARATSTIVRRRPARARAVPLVRPAGRPPVVTIQGLLDDLERRSRRAGRGAPAFVDARGPAGAHLRGARPPGRRPQRGARGGRAATRRPRRVRRPTHARRPRLAAGLLCARGSPSSCSTRASGPDLLDGALSGRPVSRPSSLDPDGARAVVEPRGPAARPGARHRAARHAAARRPRPGHRPVAGTGAPAGSTASPAPSRDRGLGRRRRRARSCSPRARPVRRAASSTRRGASRRASPRSATSRTSGRTPASSHRRRTSSCRPCSAGGAVVVPPATCARPRRGRCTTRR